MSIEITEETTRNCCDFHTDLKLYKGQKTLNFPEGDRLSFCIHCGQIWSFTWWKFDGVQHFLSWEPARIRRFDPPGPPQTHLDPPKE